MHRGNREIDKSLLHNGMVLKNWIQLCELQNWKFTKSPKSRKSQESSLYQVCRWHKEGHKIVIDEVFDDELMRSDNRIDIELIELKKVIERQIIRRLATQYNSIHYDEYGRMSFHKKMELNLTLTEWFEAVGLVNPNFRNSRKYNGTMYHLLGIDVTRSDFNNILNNSHVTLKRWLGDVFKSLTNERTIVAVEDSFKLKCHNDDKETKIKFTYVYKDATNQQIKFMKTCEGIILNRHRTNLRNVLNNYSDAQKKSFYNEVIKYIREVCCDEDFIDAYDESIKELKLLKSYYSTINVSINPMIINIKSDNIKGLTKNDLEILNILQDEMNKTDGDLKHIERQGRLICNNTTVRKVTKNSIKRLDNVNENSVSDTVYKLHSSEAKIITDTEIDEYRSGWQTAPNPFEIPFSIE